MKAKHKTRPLRFWEQQWHRFTDVRYFDFDVPLYVSEVADELTTLTQYHNNRQCIVKIDCDRNSLIHFSIEITQSGNTSNLTTARIEGMLEGYQGGTRIHGAAYSGFDGEIPIIMLASLISCSMFFALLAHPTLGVLLGLIIVVSLWKLPANVFKQSNPAREQLLWKMQRLFNADTAVFSKNKR